MVLIESFYASQPSEAGHMQYINPYSMEIYYMSPLNHVFVEHIGEYLWNMPWLFGAILYILGKHSIMKTNLSETLVLWSN